MKRKMRKDASMLFWPAIPQVIFLVFLTAGQLYGQSCNCPLPGPNLIVNGDFEDPATVSAPPLYAGFQTDYSMAYPVGVYGIFRWLGNPNTVNAAWCGQPGTNKMLIFDASTRTGLPFDAAVAPFDVLRYVNIVVVRGATYYFKFDAAHLAPSYPAAVLTLRINGLFKSAYTISNSCSNWTKYDYCWVADTTAVTVVLNEETGVLNGHDFAIDNLYFGTCTVRPVILNGDSTALDTVFCHDAVNHPVMGVPGGGTFSGCGMANSGGNWYFNPAQAAAGATSWPHQCNIVYRLPGGDSVARLMTVQEPVLVRLGPDTTACDTVTLQSSVAYSGAGYQWSTGEVTPAIRVGQSGNYWLTVTRNSCAGKDTVEAAINRVEVDLGNDTAICDRDIPLMLSSSQPPGTRYLWSTGLTTPIIDVTRSDTYWLEAQRNNCTGSDTIAVNVIRTPSIHIGNDSFICDGFPAVIGDLVPGAAYLWNTGATTPEISVSSSGEYWLEADLHHCKVRDTVRITVTPIPSPDLGVDRDICPEQVIALDAAYPNGRYLWSTGDTTSSLSVTAAGAYWVKVRSEYGCEGSDTISFNDYPLPVVMLGPDTTVCEEQPLVLKPFSVSADSLRWSDGSTGDKLEVKQGGTYMVTAINKCGEVNDTIEIRSIFCDIWVPNVFTPNGDGINDVFRVLGNTGRLEGFGLSVFNRWGQRVFYSNDKYKGWDGTYSGGNALLGVYVYMLEYNLKGKPVLQQGNFTLLR